MPRRTPRGFGGPICFLTNNLPYQQLSGMLFGQFGPPRSAVELALNIAWLVVAAALLLLCGARALSINGRRHQITACMALTCLIWLLFPVISITDDLHSGQPVFAATSVKKMAQPAIATGVLLRLPLVFPAPSRTGWREINLHADLSDISQEYFAFDLSRRPPPQAR